MIVFMHIATTGLVQETPVESHLYTSTVAHMMMYIILLPNDIASDQVSPTDAGRDLRGRVGYLSNRPLKAPPARPVRFYP